jgi:hypothetical protein
MQVKASGAGVEPTKRTRMGQSDRETSLLSMYVGSCYNDVPSCHFEISKQSLWVTSPPYHNAFEVRGD